MSPIYYIEVTGNSVKKQAFLNIGIQKGLQRFANEYVTVLCLALGHHVVGDGIVGAVWFLNRSESFLILLDIVVECHQESFHMERRHDDALTHRGPFPARQGLRKVDNELGGRMGEHRYVAVGALRHLIVDVEVKIVGGILFLCHIVYKSSV